MPFRKNWKLFQAFEQLLEFMSLQAYILSIYLDVDEPDAF